MRTPRTLDDMFDVRIAPVGDAAVMATVGDSMERPIVRRVWSLTRALNAVAGGAILDIVPAYASVLVRFDPFALDAAHVMALVRGAAERASDVDDTESRRFSIPVCFGGECGIDFESAAHELGMREARFRDTFCRPDYEVAFIGFVAGFPYLMGLPPALALPRLATPRPRVPAGSVAIAAAQCGIYPRQSPGGWRLLGRTLVSLFDVARSRPALLAPGDAVRFVPAERLDSTADIAIEPLPTR